MFGVIILYKNIFHFINVDINKMSYNLLKTSIEPYRTVQAPTLSELRKTKPKADKKKKKKGMLKTGQEQRQSGVNLLRESNRTNILMANELLP